MKPTIFPLLLLIVGCGLGGINGVAATSGGDPYRILGVDKTASQDEIKKRYRKLCLKYHPDKNVNKLPKEREKCEAMFKRIQKANNMIGTSEARQDYDHRATSPFYRADSSSESGFSPSFASSSGQSPYGATDLDSLFRAFSASQKQHGSPSFYFRTGAGTNLFSFSPLPLSGFKSIFVQKVKVKLEDLYAGAQGLEFEVKDTLWKRYRASFRGGSCILSLYQALVYALPLLRLGKHVALATCLTVFHKTLPRPRQKSYTVNLQPGYKGGKTKVNFRSKELGEPEVVFELEEEKHERFKRNGNDLHTTITITPSQAKKGCTVQIEPLDEEEQIIEVVIAPNEIHESGDEVRVPGRGWPIRNTSSDENQENDGTQRMPSGDLVVRVLVKKQRHRKTKKS